MSTQNSEIIEDGVPLTQEERRWTITLYSLATVLLFADQNLLAPNLSAIADEFGFDDVERDAKLGGEIALAFFFMGAVASFIVGFLTDYIKATNRSSLFAVTIFIGEGGCFMTYFTRTYGQLFWCRAMTGFSVGGSTPLIYSVLGDLYAAHERSSVSAIVGMGTGIGIGAGQFVSGFLGPAFGWRVPFLVIAIPAMAVATALMHTVRDPPRGAKESTSSLDHDGNGDSSDLSVMNMEVAMIDMGSSAHARVRRTSDGENYNSCIITDSDDDDSSALSDTSFSIVVHPETNGVCLELFDLIRSLKLLIRIPTVALMILQALPGCLPWGVINTYLNDYLSKDRGMSVEGATMTLTIFGFGLFFGMYLGGKGGERLYAIDVRYPSILMGSAAIFGYLTMDLMINDVHASSSYLSIASTSFVGGMGTGITGPIVKATLSNVTLPMLRGKAFAFLNIFDDLGNGLGPAFVSLLITRYGRKRAFNISFLGWIACGVFNLFSFFYVRQDEENMRRRHMQFIKEKSRVAVAMSLQSGELL